MLPTIFEGCIFLILCTVKDLKLILEEHHKLYFSSGKTLTSVETNFLCLFSEQCARAVVPI